MKKLPQTPHLTFNFKKANTNNFSKISYIHSTPPHLLFTSFLAPGT